MGTKHLQQIELAWREAPCIGGKRHGWRVPCYRPKYLFSDEPKFSYVVGDQQLETKPRTSVYHNYGFGLWLNGYRFHLTAFCQREPIPADVVALISYLQCHRN